MVSLYGKIRGISPLLSHMPHEMAKDPDVDFRDAVDVIYRIDNDLKAHGEV